MTPDKMLAYWKRFEPYAFTLVTLVSLAPFFYFRFFPSMDGASHLYNANIINHLLFDRSDLFRQFFAINPEPVPNWTGHLVTALLMLVFPAYVAEKILIAGLLVATSFAFRKLVKAIAPHNILFSWLVFPFSHSMFFFFGFFNFCIALLFMLISLTMWLQFMNKPWNFRKTLWLVLLFAITYFSHIVIFGLLLILVSVQLLYSFSGELNKTSRLHSRVRPYLSRAGAILAASAVPLMLFGYFFYSRPGTRDWHFSTTTELVKHLVTVRPLVSFDPFREEPITSALFVVLVVLLITAIILKWLRRSQPGHTTIQEQHGPASLNPAAGHAGWLYVSILILLLLYFLMPDAYGSASYTNLRIALVIFLVLILLISTFRIPGWMTMSSVALALVIDFLLLLNHAPTIYEMARVARSCHDASRYIPENAVVLPVYSMDNWFTGHFVDYLAVDKPVVMVYNYECESGYFPVVWNHENRPNFYLGDPSDSSSFLNFVLYKGRPAIELDYVFVVGKIDPVRLPFFRILKNILSTEYRIIYKGAFCTLYQRRPPS